MCVCVHRTEKKSFNFVCQLESIFNVTFSWTQKKKRPRDNNKVMRNIIRKEK